MSTVYEYTVAKTWSTVSLCRQKPNLAGPYVQRDEHVDDSGHSGAGRREHDRFGCAINRCPIPSG